MSWFEGLITYTVVWWLIFFMALPIGAEPARDPMPGTVESAPARPRLWWKVGATSLIAALLTWTIYWVIQSGLIQLRP